MELVELLELLEQQVRSSSSSELALLELPEKQELSGLLELPGLLEPKLVLELLDSSFRTRPGDLVETCRGARIGRRVDAHIALAPAPIIMSRTLISLAALATASAFTVNSRSRHQVRACSHSTALQHTSSLTTQQRSPPPITAAATTPSAAPSIAKRRSVTRAALDEPKSEYKITLLPGDGIGEYQRA